MRALRSAALGLLLGALGPPAEAEPAAPPLVIAHRGVTDGEPENSLAGFRRALARGAWIEADVRRARDGSLVVIHDAQLGRTTDGRGRVARRTFPELRSLTLRGLVPAGEATPRIPALAEVLALEGAGLGVVIDVKEPDAAMADALARVLSGPRGALAVAFGFREAAFAAQLRRRVPAARQLGFIGRPSEIEAFAAAQVESIRLHDRWLAREPELAARVRASGAELVIGLDAADSEALKAALAHAPAALLCDHAGAALDALAARAPGAR